MTSVPDLLPLEEWDDTLISQAEYLAVMCEERAKKVLAEQLAQHYEVVGGLFKAAALLFGTIRGTEEVLGIGWKYRPAEIDWRAP